MNVAPSQDLMTRFKVQAAITAAWTEYGELYEAEEAGGFSDAMESMERKYAEGVADGLSSAYFMIYNESFPPLEDDSAI
jgi:hypothetical protein